MTGCPTALRLREGEVCNVEGLISGCVASSGTDA